MYFKFIYIYIYICISKINVIIIIIKIINGCNGLTAILFKHVYELNYYYFDINNAYRIYYVYISLFYYYIQ